MSGFKQLIFFTFVYVFCFMIKVWSAPIPDSGPTPESKTHPLKGPDQPIYPSQMNHSMFSEKKSISLLLGYLVGTKVSDQTSNDFHLGFESHFDSDDINTFNLQWSISNNNWSQLSGFYKMPILNKFEDPLYLKLGLVHFIKTDHLPASIVDFHKLQLAIQFEWLSAGAHFSIGQNGSTTGLYFNFYSF